MLKFGVRNVPVRNNPNKYAQVLQIQVPDSQIDVFRDLLGFNDTVEEMRFRLEIGRMEGCVLVDPSGVKMTRDNMSNWGIRFYGLDVKQVGLGCRFTDMPSTFMHDGFLFELPEKRNTRMGYANKHDKHLLATPGRSY